MELPSTDVIFVSIAGGLVALALLATALLTAYQLFPNLF